VFSLLSVPGVTGQLGVLYAALLCALSSTAIVVKLLYDKFELDTRAGRLTIGILVIQDLWAILVLALQPNFSSPDVSLIGVALVKSVALVLVGYVVSKFILGPIFERVCKSPEVVMLLSLGWCASMAAMAQYFELSKEMGALIAGASVSAFPYRIHVIAKTLPLRDFFITLFFVSLGMKIVAPERALLEGALIITAFVVISRFLSVYPLLRLAGGGYRSAFLTSINLAQVSEFSLVIASLGIGFGHVGADFMAMIIYAMGLSAVLSSYLIKYNSQLYTLCFSKRRVQLAGGDGAVVPPEVVSNMGLRDIFVLGYHHCGRALVKSIQENNPQLLNRMKVIDFNLEALRELESLPVKAVFADLSSLDTLEHLHLERARVILLTLPDLLLKGTSNQRVAGLCRAIAPHAVIIGMADSEQHRADLVSSGANDAILWYHTKADSLAALIKDVDSGQSEPGEAGVLEEVGA
jgi:Kef-type K+ transport system membrane component KefB